MSKHVFKVVAERSAGLFYDGRPVRNPFLIRNIFDPNLRSKTERRTWEKIEAKDEAEVRRLFAQAIETLPDMKGFALVRIERVPDAEA